MMINRGLFPFLLAIFLDVGLTQIVRREASKNPTYLGVVVNDVSFEDVAKFPFETDTLLQALKQQAAKPLEVSADSIQPSALLPHSKGVLLFFKVDDPEKNVKVENSDSPDFEAYKGKLQAISPDGISFRNTPVTVQAASIAEPENWKAPLKEWPPVIEASDLQQLRAAVESRRELLQLKLRSPDFDQLQAQDYEALANVIHNLAFAVASILTIESKNVVITDIKGGSTILQFTRHPATEEEVKAASAMWSQAVPGGDRRLLDVLPDVDVEYPPVFYKDTTEPPQDPDADEEEGGGSKKGGKIAGAVVGSVGGVALLAGAAGGYAYWKKKKAATEAANNAGQRHMRDEERSPGAGVFSPTGLAQVNIDGDRTPNPYNPRQ